MKLLRLTLRLILSFLSCLAGSGISEVGFTSFANEVIDINSEKLLINSGSNSATFEHEVEVLFGDIKIITSKLIVYYEDINNKNQIKSIVIPHGLKAVKDYGNEVLTADRAEFDGSTGKLKLIGRVHLKKGENIVVTDELIYITEFNLIRKNSNAK